MKLLNLLAIACATMALASCASVSVKRVTSYDQPGIRYWRPALYLALQQVVDGKTTTCQVKSFVLPDKTEEYAITANAGFGTVEASPTLTDGWNLTSMTGKADSKTAENLTALASVLKSVAPAGIQAQGASAPKATTKLIQPKCEGIFKFKYDTAGNLVGFQPIPLPVRTTVIDISPGVTPPEKKPDDKACGTASNPCPK